MAVEHVIVGGGSLREKSDEGKEADWTKDMPLRTFANLNIAAGSKDSIRDLIAAGLPVDAEMIRFARSNGQREIVKMLEIARHEQMDKMAEKGVNKLQAGDFDREMRKTIRSHLRGIIPDDKPKSQQGKKKQRH